MKKEDLFKSIGSIEDTLIERSEKKDRKKWYKKTRGVAIVAGVCICVLGASLIYPEIMNQPQYSGVDKIANDLGGNNNSNKQEEVEKNVIGSTGEAKLDRQLQERIQELRNGDALGWIVINNRIYIQTQKDSVEKAPNLENKDKYLGKASSFIGYYQNTDSSDGKVYVLSDDEEKIYIQLDNGGIVFLAVEEATITTQDASVDGTSYRQSSDYPVDIMDIQEDISTAMSRGELPFVISSAIMENPLRLEVTVTTDDEKILDKVWQHDPSRKYIFLIQAEKENSLQ